MAEFLATEAAYKATVIAAEGDGVDPAIILTSISGKLPQYLFNSPDGFSRLALEHKLRPNAKLKALFFTSLHPRATSGIGPLLLRLSQDGHDSLMIIGPPGTMELVQCLRNLFIWTYPSVTVKEFSFNGCEPSVPIFEDLQVAVFPLFKSGPSLPCPKCLQDTYYPPAELKTENPEKPVTKSYDSDNQDSESSESEGPDAGPGGSTMVNSKEDLFSKLDSIFAERSNHGKLNKAVFGEIFGDSAESIDSQTRKKQRLEDPSKGGKASVQIERCTCTMSRSVLANKAAHQLQNSYYQDSCNSSNSGPASYGYFCLLKKVRSSFFIIDSEGSPECQLDRLTASWHSWANDTLLRSTSVFHLSGQFISKSMTCPSVKVDWVLRNLGLRVLNVFLKCDLNLSEIGFLSSSRIQNFLHTVSGENFMEISSGVGTKSIGEISKPGPNFEPIPSQGGPIIEGASTADFLRGNNLSPLGGRQEPGLNWIAGKLGLSLIFSGNCDKSAQSNVQIDLSCCPENLVDIEERTSSPRTPKNATMSGCHPQTSARDEFQQIFDADPAIWKAIHCTCLTSANATGRVEADLKQGKKCEKCGELFELLFLGTGSAEPNKYRACSGILATLTSGNGQSRCILLDCGNGTAGQLSRHLGGRQALRKMIRMGQISMVWISHKHADHAGGILQLIGECELSNYPLLIVGPTVVGNWIYLTAEAMKKSGVFLPPYRFLPCQAMTGVRFQPSISANRPVDEILYNNILRELGLRYIQSVPVIHCMDSWAIVFMFLRGPSICYSGDTRPCLPLIAAAKNCTVLIHEATYVGPEYQRLADRNRHSTIPEALWVGSRMNASRIILTHFSQRHPKEMSVNPISAKRACVVYDGMRIKASQLPLMPDLLPKLTKAFEDREEQKCANERQLAAARIVTESDTSHNARNDTKLKAKNDTELNATSETNEAVEVEEGSQKPSVPPRHVRFSDDE